MSFEATDPRLPQTVYAPKTVEELEELRLGENRIRSLKRVGQKPVLLDACMVYVYIYIHYRYILYITYIESFNYT